MRCFELENCLKIVKAIDSLAIMEIREMKNKKNQITVLIMTLLMMLMMTSAVFADSWTDHDRISVQTGEAVYIEPANIPVLN